MGYFFRFIVLFLIGIVCIGCSDNFKPKRLGKCVVNFECPNGTRCIDGYCEDIYHPRKKIKTY